MQGFIKTLFGDLRTVITAAFCIGLAIVLLHTKLYPLTGLVFPLSLLAAAAYLAKR
jgi:hypothetical protein